MQTPTAPVKSQDWLFQKGEILFMGKKQVIVVDYLCQHMESCQPQPAQRDVWMSGNL